MRDREAMQLRGFTALHNGFLSVLSLIMFCGQLYETVQAAGALGWGNVFCWQQSGPPNGSLYFWAYLFYLSKYYELIDTVPCRPPLHAAPLLPGRLEPPSRTRLAQPHAELKGFGRRCYWCSRRSRSTSCTATTTRSCRTPPRSASVAGAPAPSAGPGHVTRSCGCGSLGARVVCEEYVRGGETCPVSTGGRDETCPVSTGGRDERLTARACRYMPIVTGTLFNSLVHVVMYYYYMQASLGKTVWWKRYLTVFQIVQFCSGFGFTLLFFAMYFRNFAMSESNGSFHVSFSKGCNAEVAPVFFTAAVNVSFLVLFCKFYGRAYSKKPTARPAADHAQMNGKKHR
jgi:hypothetical protein